MHGLCLFVVMSSVGGVGGDVCVGVGLWFVFVVLGGEEYCGLRSDGGAGGLAVGPPLWGLWSR